MTPPPNETAGAPPAPEPPRRPAVVVTVPTFNESGNIGLLLDGLLALGPGFQVVVIDDDSPDGTWKIVADRAARDPRVHLLHRRADKGRGRSGRDGFVKALELGAPVVIEMDADLSHQPKYIPDMIRRLNGGPSAVGLVLGSRATQGGKDADRGVARRGITKLANLYIRVVLGVPVRDCNSGFRAWRRETLETIRVGETFSAGPAIVQELLFKTARARIGIAEVPIEFQNRQHGESTLTIGKLLTGYVTVLKLRWMSLVGRI
ncbi:MAG: glycosyltransferase [Planctomycetota bacterium]|nr:glycosyltransferase [Planctomycetota bacterium]